jgi:hypothetical protein
LGRISTRGKAISINKRLLRLKSGDQGAGL